MRCVTLNNLCPGTRFWRASDGGMIVFGLFALIAILLVSGLAVDFMRYENTRVRVQATADRASLAAATLRETGDREALVRDYFEKAQLTQFLESVEVDEALNSATVTVRTRPGVNTLFVRWVGIDTFTSHEASVAREEVTNLEIVLVLDISGSMRWTDSGGMPRIERLRGAARTFVSTVLNPDAPDAITISIVPYAGTVNPGQQVFDLLGGTAWHAYSHCPDLPRSTFDSTGLPDIGTMPQAPHFMYWAIDWAYMDWGWCPNDSNSIKYHSSSEADLHAYLNSLRLHDGTGTHYGMRWGITLLDPDSRWVTAELAASGVVDPGFANRPAAWDDPDSMKVVVLMTDGIITEQVRPRRRNSSIYGRDGVYPTTKEQDELDSTHIAALNSNRRREITNRAQNSADFDTTCALARANGVIIYTIAFETDSRGQDEMRRCATSPGHFFNAQGLDLDRAFRAIATSIQALRLVQ